MQDAWYDKENKQEEGDSKLFLPTGSWNQISRGQIQSNLEDAQARFKQNLGADLYSTSTLLTISRHPDMGYCKEMKKDSQTTRQKVDSSAPTSCITD